MRQRRGGSDVQTTSELVTGSTPETAEAATELEATTRTEKEVPCIRVVELESRGRGVVADRDIVCGELVSVEKPFLVINFDDKSWPSVVEEQLNALPADQRDEVMSLQDAFAVDGKKTVEGIVRTNSISRGMSLTEAVQGGVTSYFNHSCVPNCDFCWDENTFELRVYAARDIPSGEELCIYYVDVRATRKQRARELWDRYRFTCTCACCSQPAEESAASDARRKQLSDMNSQFDDIGAKKPKIGVQVVCEFIELCDAECLCLKSFRKRACYYGFQFCVLTGEDAGAAWWIERAHEYSVMCHGPHHEQTLHLAEYVKDPSSHPLADRAFMNTTWYEAVRLLVPIVCLSVVSFTVYNTVTDNLAGNS